MEQPNALVHSNVLGNTACLSGQNWYSAF